MKTRIKDRVSGEYRNELKLLANYTASFHRHLRLHVASNGYKYLKCVPSVLVPL